MERLILVKYGEIHLKGNNRPYFEKRLVANIQQALPECKVERAQGRLYVRGFADEEAAVARLTKIFGIHGLSIAYEVEKDWDVICACARELMTEAAKTGQTFKAMASRADKTFPLRSPEIAARLGEYLLQNLPGLRVDVKNPQVRITVEVREQAYVYTDATSIPGPGGMPVGTGGKAMLLLSGGIDSPVAGWMMAKRGVQLEAIHFHSFPYTSEHARQKVIDLAKIMSAYCGRFRLHIVPFTEIQEQIHQQCPPDQLTVIMRRLMMTIAERTARRNHALALITGESLGQVASQTIHSLAVTDNAVSMPVFRPLIGFDKLDIIRIAEKIDTYETSILPYEDCCTVFTPRHPVTHPDLDSIRRGESAVDWEPLIRRAMENTEVLRIGY